MTHEKGSFPAMLGCDFVRAGNWQMVKKTRAGWNQYARKLAKENSQRDRFAWFHVVAWIPWRNCYRITLAGDYRK